MEYFSFLRKKDYSSSPWKSANPKSALEVIVTNVVDDFGQVNKDSSADYIDASPEHTFRRDDSVTNSNWNSPKLEQFAPPVSKYDDVFGGPPSYKIPRSSPVYDEIYRVLPRSPPCWKDSDFPVFGTPVQDDGALGAMSGKGSMLDDRRMFSSGFRKNNLSASGMRSRVSSRSNSCVQSPLRRATPSFFDDSMHNNFLAASVRLRTGPKEVAESLREREKIGGISISKTLGRDSRGNWFASNENVATTTFGTFSEEAYSPNCGTATPKDTAYNPNISNDEPKKDPSSSLVSHKDGTSASYSGDDVKFDKVSMKIMPTEILETLRPASSPFLKNQRSYLQRKYRMEPTEDFCTQANSDVQTAKEGASSPSSSFHRSSRAGPGPFARTTPQWESQKPAPGKSISSTSCCHLEALDKDAVKNQAEKQMNKDFDIFASAVAAIENAESRFKFANAARQKEKLIIFPHEEKALERQAESREDRSGNGANEGKVDTTGSSRSMEENVRRSRNQPKEMAEPEIIVYHEVLEREEIEALEAVDTERKAVERHADRCRNAENEVTVDKMGSSGAMEENIRKSKKQAKEMEEPEIRFYHEVLEREDIEALEAVDKEREQREKKRQKERELQKASLEMGVNKEEEPTAAEFGNGSNEVMDQQLKRVIAEQSERPTLGSRLLTEISAGRNVLGGSAATAKIDTVREAEIETLQKLVRNISLSSACIASDETREQIPETSRDQQPKDQHDIKQPSLEADLVEKLAENCTPVGDAEYVSMEEVVDDWSSTPKFEKVEDAWEEKAVRTELNLERVVKALNEKNQRDFEAEQEQAEKHRLGKLLDGDIKKWASGKEQNLRALLSTLQYALWPESGWQPVYLTDIINPASVKKVYRKATLFIHPDKMQQKGASLQEKYIAEKVFYLLKDAWSRFNFEEIL